MRVQFYYKELNDNEKQGLTKYVNSKIDHINKFLSFLDEATVRLEVKAEKFAKKAAYQVEFILLIPKQSFTAKEDDHTLNEAVDFAFGKLLKQLSRAVSKLRKEHISSRRRAQKEAWNEIEELAARPAELTKEVLFKMVLPLLESFKLFVNHELYLAVLTGIVDKGEIEADEIIDQALLNCVAKLSKDRPSEIEFETWCYREILQTLRAKLKEATERRSREISLEAPVKGTAAEKLFDTLEQEVKDFWQPFESLTLADLIPESAPTADRVPPSAELTTSLIQDLQQLDAREREAFMLHQTTHLSEREIAEIQARALGQVKADIGKISRVIKEKLARVAQ